MKTSEEIQTDVEAEIGFNPELRAIATEIGVAVKDNIVTLTGTVDSFRKKILVEEAAQKVAGVKVVASDVIVQIPGSEQKSDTQLAEIVKSALRWNTAVNEDRVEVKVDDGWVYLTGQVDWQFEKDSASRSVECLAGIKGVINTITLRIKKIDPKAIQVGISNAFHRRAAIDSSAIQVNANGHSVILTGKVKSWSEKKEAEEVAWSSPGVSIVQNKIEVEGSLAM